MFKKLLSITFTVIFLSSCSSEKESVDLIIHHAVIYSVDSAFTVYEAMCIKDGKIMELNTNEALLKKYESANSIDAQGKTIFPGFIDAHCHFLGYGLGLQQVDLVGTRSFNEVMDRVIAFSNRKPLSPEGSQKTVSNAGQLSN